MHDGILRAATAVAQSGRTAERNARIDRDGSLGLQITNIDITTVQFTDTCTYLYL